MSMQPASGPRNLCARRDGCDESTDNCSSVASIDGATPGRDFSQARRARANAGVRNRRRLKIGLLASIPPPSSDGIGRR